MFTGFSISCFVIKKLTWNKFELNKLAEMKIRLFLNQSASDIIYMMRAIRVTGALSQLSFSLMIAIWIQSASILTKAFTGLLLNTYFRSDFGPLSPLWKTSTKIEVFLWFPMRGYKVPGLKDQTLARIKFIALYIE